MNNVGCENRNAFEKDSEKKNDCGKKNSLKKNDEGKNGFKKTGFTKNGLKKNGLNILTKNRLKRNGSKKKDEKKKDRRGNGLKAEPKNDDLEKESGDRAKNGLANADCPNRDREARKPREPAMLNFRVPVKRVSLAVVVADGNGGRAANWFAGWNRADAGGPDIVLITP